MRRETIQPVTQTTSDLLTLSECADLIGISRGTLYNWRMNQYGPTALRDSAPVMYLRAEVEAWIAQARCGECGRAHVKGGKDE